MNISSIALQGLEQAQAKLQTAVSQLSSVSSPASGGADADIVDLSVAAVAMVSAKDQSSANVNVTKVADDMQKNLLSVLG